MLAEFIDAFHWSSKTVFIFRSFLYSTRVTVMFRCSLWHLQVRSDLMFLVLRHSVPDLEFPARDILSAVALRSRPGWQSADKGQRVLAILAAWIPFAARAKKKAVITACDEYEMLQESHPCWIEFMLSVCSSVFSNEVELRNRSFGKSLILCTHFLSLSAQNRIKPGKGWG
jgi:hypothetical protein